MRLRVCLCPQDPVGALHPGTEVNGGEGGA